MALSSWAERGAWIRAVADCENMSENNRKSKDFKEKKSTRDRQDDYRRHDWSGLSKAEESRSEFRSGLKAVVGAPLFG